MVEPAGLGGNDRVHRRGQQSRVGRQPDQRDEPDQPGGSGASARGHHRDVHERARRRLHDDRGVQLRPGRDRHVLRVRRLGAHGRSRAAAAGGPAARGAGGGAPVRHPARPGGHAAPAGQGPRGAAHGDRRTDVRVDRAREHDLEPEQRALDAVPVQWPRVPRRSDPADLAPVRHDRGRDRPRGWPSRPVVPDTDRRRDPRCGRQPRPRPRSKARAPRCSRASRGHWGVHSPRSPASCSRRRRPTCRPRRSPS